MQTLSVFFNIDRVYAALVGPGEKGMELRYVNSTRHHIDLENPDYDESRQGIDELLEIIGELPGEVDKLTITLPAESVLISQFPGKKNMSEEDLRKLVNLEIRNAYPQFNYDDFSTNVIPLAARMDGTQMFLAAIIPNLNFQTCRDLFSSLPVELNNVDISQMNSHSAFLYNHPEYKDKNVALFGVQDQFIDLSLIKSGSPAYYSLLSLADKSSLPEIFENQFTELNDNIVSNIDAAFFYGTGLTKDLFIAAWETSMLLGIEFGRVNAFRMFHSTLDKRKREYCSRTGHIFPPCIGGALAEQYDKIKLYQF